MGGLGAVRSRGRMADYSRISIKPFRKIEITRV